MASRRSSWCAEQDGVPLEAGLQARVGRRERRPGPARRAAEVPEQADEAARAQDVGRAPRAPHGVDPVPRLAAGDEVEAPAGVVPALEGRLLDGHAVAAREGGHPRVGLDAQDPAAARLQGAGGDPGAAADVERRRAARRPPARRRAPPGSRAAPGRSARPPARRTPRGPGRRAARSPADVVALHDAGAVGERHAAGQRARERAERLAVVAARRARGRRGARARASAVKRRTRRRRRGRPRGPRRTRPAPARARRSPTQTRALAAGRRVVDAGDEVPPDVRARRGVTPTPALQRHAVTRAW